MYIWWAVTSVDGESVDNASYGSGHGVIPKTVRLPRWEMEMEKKEELSRHI